MPSNDRKQKKRTTMDDDEADYDEENRINYSTRRTTSQDDDDFDDQNSDYDEDGEEGNGDDESFKVFSGLTESERRAIRHDQRALQKKLVEGDSVDVEDARGQNNKIFKKVKFTREAVLDSDNLNLIATKASHKMDRLIEAPRYDADKVVDKLRKKLGSRGNFSWVTMGEEGGVLYNCIPSSVVFLSGPLRDGREEIQVKQRAKRQTRRVDDDVEEEKPEDVKGHTERGVDHLSAHEKNVDVVLKTLSKSFTKEYKHKKQLIVEKTGEDEISSKARKRLKKGATLCAVNLLYNPRSFTQTVENMFHYSYLVKKGNAGLSVRNEDLEYDDVVIAEAGPRARPIDKKPDAGPHPAAKQSVVALTMKNWRDMVEAYGVEESQVPHRSGSKVKKRDHEEDDDEED
mmetsp:Transcript_4803/g.12203  ORF Transcript_4803/g.12203 Transcript_4803/m.12203 type:complete len:401 (+) Transcript_4803:119-1321(+)